jgi:conjugal transfer pilus assembly protein TraW
MIIQKPAFDRSGHLSMVPVTINPLAAVPFSRPILIFDGRKERQIQLARRLSNQPMVILTTAGDPVPLSQLFGRAVYPVSQNILTRFGITRVPAFLQRQGDAIRVDEILP